MKFIINEIDFKNLQHVRFFRRAAWSKTFNSEFASWQWLQNYTNTASCGWFRMLSRGVFILHFLVSSQQN